MAQVNPFAADYDDGYQYVIGVALSDSEDGFVDVLLPEADEMPEDGSEEYGENTSIVELEDDGGFMVSPGTLDEYDEDPELYDED